MSAARLRATPAAGQEGPADSVAGSRSVLRALEILDLLADTEQPLGLARIAKEFGIPKSSCLALLRALCARRFVKQEPGGAYVLGLRSFEVGAAYLRAVTPVSAATAELRALTGRLGMTSHFAVLEGDEVVYLAKQDPPGTGVRLASSLGARLSAWTTAVGQAQLAFGEERTGAEAARVAGELEEVRRRGYAVDEGTTAAGIRCVAAPVFSAGGCCGAVGVSYLLHDGVDVPVIGDLLAAAATRVSAELGGAGVAVAVAAAVMTDALPLDQLGHEVAGTVASCPGGELPAAAGSSSPQMAVLRQAPRELAPTDRE